MRHFFPLLIFLFFTKQAFAQVDLFSQSSELHDLMENYSADWGSLSRFYFINGSPERNDRMQKFLKEYQQQLHQLNFENLSQNGKVDYLLFDNQLNRELSQWKKEAEDYQNIAVYFKHLGAIYELETKRRRGYSMDGREVAQQLNDLVAKNQTYWEDLSVFPLLNHAQLKLAQRVIQGYEEAMESVFEFYNGYDPLFTWWVPKPYQELLDLLEDLAVKIEGRANRDLIPMDDGSGIIGNPIGRAAIIEELQFAMIPYTPEELIEIAHKEFAWCEKEMLKASEELGFGSNWKAALESVKELYVPAGKQPEAMLELYHQSIAFLKENDLITIPPLAEETWRMRMMSAEQQKVSPFFLGGEVFQIAYPVPEMSHEEKMMSMRGNNPHFSRATVHHELIAGHHLQQFMNRRHKTYRFFRTPFWTEGWALYWEMILWDMNFPRDAKDKVGMLFWRMHRCARIIFSLNYHTLQWTPQQCIDFLVEKVGHERANAEGEVRRSFTGGYGPLYQLAYMLGALQFYALKEELVDKGTMELKAFHDAVMGENAMPVEMVRALLSNQSISEDYRTNWRFYKGLD
jgi:uncharacterized protein (DUF885 family)